MAEKKSVAKKVIAKKAVAKKAATRKPKVSAALQLAQVAARAADEKQGSNITVLNVGDIIPVEIASVEKERGRIALAWPDKAKVDWQVG